MNRVWIDEYMKGLQTLDWFKDFELDRVVLFCYWGA